MKNFGLIKNRFSEITGHSSELPPTSQIKIVPSEEPSQGSRSKRSAMSSIFRFLFSREDNSEAINMLKQNVATLMANDELHEKRLKDLLQSQQLNAGEIKINHDLLQQVTQQLAQINITLNDVTFNTHMLFSLASFQVSISQLCHRVSVILDALFGLQMNLDILYHHFSAMVDNKLSPEMISPKNRLVILQQVKDDIRDHPRLSLPED